MARQPLGGLVRLIFRGFTITHCFRHTTLGNTPLDEGPARRRDLYLTTHNTHNLSKRAAVDRTATGIGRIIKYTRIKLHCKEIKTFLPIKNSRIHNEKGPKGSTVMPESHV
jgi:hypothetical protein